MESRQAAVPAGVHRPDSEADSGDERCGGGSGSGGSCVRSLSKDQPLRLRARQPAIERDPRRRGTDTQAGVRAGGEFAGDGPGAEEAGGFRALPGTTGEDIDERARRRGEVFRGAAGGICGWESSRGVEGQGSADGGSAVGGDSEGEFGRGVLKRKESRQSTVKSRRKRSNTEGAENTETTEKIKPRRSIS